MTLNLISMGAIVPQQLSITGIVDQISTIFNIPTSRILEIQYWPHQLWMNISGVGGRIFSYRPLPAWLNQVIITIKNCNTMDEIQKLGEILNNENQHLPKYYNSENIGKLREVWSEKRQDLRSQEEENQPLTKHQKEAQRWLRAWEGILPYCEDLEPFKGVMKVMDMQSQKFADFPEIVNKVRHACEQKLRELENRIF